METGKKDRTELAQKRALADYDDRLTSVWSLKEMTDTSSWQRFYSGCCRVKDEAAKEILVAEKPRDMIVCQERIKAVDHLLREVQAPIDELNRFINSMPLFAGEYHTRASWNSSLGTVEIRGLERDAIRNAAPNTRQDDVDPPAKRQRRGE